MSNPEEAFTAFAETLTKYRDAASIKIEQQFSAAKDAAKEDINHLYSTLMTKFEEFTETQKRMRKKKKKEKQRSSSDASKPSTSVVNPGNPTAPLLEPHKATSTGQPTRAQKEATPLSALEPVVKIEVDDHNEVSIGPDLPFRYTNSAISDHPYSYNDYIDSPPDASVSGYVDTVESYGSPKQQQQPELGESVKKLLEEVGDGRGEGRTRSGSSFKAPSLISSSASTSKAPTSKASISSASTSKASTSTTSSEPSTSSLPAKRSFPIIVTVTPEMISINPNPPGGKRKLPESAASTTPTGTTASKQPRTEPTNDEEEIIVIESDDEKERQMQQPTAKDETPSLIIHFLKCTVERCNVKVKTRSALEHHLLAAHKIQRWRCYVRACGKSFAKREKLNEHLRGPHFNLLNWPCCKHSCSTLHDTYDQLRTHYVRVHIEGHFGCGKCDYESFRNSNDILVHRRRAHSNAGIRCSVPGCTKEFINSFFLNIHMQQQHDGDKPFRCPDCGLHFGKRTNLTQHQRRQHLDLKPFWCKWPGCAFQGMTGHTLVIHVRSVHFGLPKSLKIQQDRGIVDRRDPHEYIAKVNVSDLLPPKHFDWFEKSKESSSGAQENPGTLDANEAQKIRVEENGLQEDQKLIEKTQEETDNQKKSSSQNRDHVNGSGGDHQQENTSQMMLLNEVQHSNDQVLANGHLDNDDDDEKKKKETNQGTSEQPKMNQIDQIQDPGEDSSSTEVEAAEEEDDAVQFVKRSQVKSEEDTDGGDG